MSGPTVLVLFIERFLGITATAAFGFARTLTDQVRKYLPSELLIGMIRPMIISEFERSQSMPLLALHHGMLLKFGMIPVALAISAVIGFGHALVELAGGAKYPESEQLLLGLLFWVLSFLLRRNLELFLNTSHNSPGPDAAQCLCRRAVPADRPGPMASGYGLFSLVIAMPACDLLGSAVAIYGLRLQGIRYHLPVFTCLKLRERPCWSGWPCMRSPRHRLPIR